jgi:hypothetical protein
MRWSNKEPLAACLPMHASTPTPTCYLSESLGCGGDLRGAAQLVQLLSSLTSHSHAPPAASTDTGAGRNSGARCGYWVAVGAE